MSVQTTATGIGLRRRLSGTTQSSNSGWRRLEERKQVSRHARPSPSTRIWPATPVRRCMSKQRRMQPHRDHSSDRHGGSSRPFFFHVLLGVRDGPDRRTDGIRRHKEQTIRRALDSQKLWRVSTIGPQSGSARHQRTIMNDNLLKSS